MGRKRPPKPAKKATDDEKKVSVEQLTEDAEDLRVSDEDLEPDEPVQPENVGEEGDGASMGSKVAAAAPTGSLEEPTEKGNVCECIRVCVLHVIGWQFLIYHPLWLFIISHQFLNCFLESDYYFLF